MCSRWTALGKPCPVIALAQELDGSWVRIQHHKPDGTDTVCLHRSVWQTAYRAACCFFVSEELIWPSADLRAILIS